MIESSLAFGSPAPQQEPGYNNWRNSVAVSARRHGGAMRYDLNERTAGPMPVFGSMLDKNTVAMAQANGTTSALADPVAQTADRPDIAYETLPAEDGYSFGDVIDMINPLQHLPVVGMLYRKFTGDTIKPFASIVGGALFGGPVGAVSSTVNAIVHDRTGKDIAENALSLAGIDMSPSKTAKEDLVYLAPKEQEELPGTTLAVANLSIARDGRHNFAKANPIPMRWNT